MRNSPGHHHRVLGHAVERTRVARVTAEVRQRMGDIFDFDLVGLRVERPEGPTGERPYGRPFAPIDALAPTAVRWQGWNHGWARRVVTLASHRAATSTKGVG